ISLLKYVVIPFILSVLSSNLSGQIDVEIPLGKRLAAEVPLEYSFRAGSETIKKTVYVELVVEDLSVFHSGIKSFVDGGLMGGMACDIVFNTWFTYSKPKGIYVDGELIDFKTLNTNGINFNLQNVRFIWTQNNGNTRYKEYNMGSPSLNTNPKTHQPGYNA